MALQGVGLCTGMLAWIPGYAAAGILALVSPLYLAVLPILAPVSSALACSVQPHLLNEVTHSDERDVPNHGCAENMKFSRCLLNSERKACLVLHLSAACRSKGCGESARLKVQSAPKYSSG